MRFFGGLGLIALVISGLTYLFLLVYWLVAQTQVRPLFSAAGVLLLAGLILFLIGFLAELIVSQGERLVDVERLVRERNAGSTAQGTGEDGP